ncbi:MAG: hypothetical protein JXR64_12010 [Spirochaetales bacterium]|nr:hypothetical protein [Spirochaetales bacterium]
MEEENREILDKIDEIQNHFYNYLFTKTVRDITLSVSLKERDWDFIKRLEGQKSLIFGRRNFKIEEIYDILVPFSQFLKNAKTEILPKLKHIIEASTTRVNLSPKESSIRKILLDNYERNIITLGKLILELYDLAVIEDIKVHKDNIPLCLTIKEIKSIEDDLKFIEEYQQL